MTQLAEIAPGAKPIWPKSQLIADLGFDSFAFGQLAVLLSERYDAKGTGASALREELTVEAIYRRYVLEKESRPG